MAFVVVYDANALYGNTLRDLLIRIGISGMVHAKWTNEILDEMLENLGKNRPDIRPETLERLRDLINNSIRDCLVENYSSLIEGLDLPDPDDRHVLAAAIKVGAQVIVSSDKGGFPAKYLENWDIEKKEPDEFVLDQIDLHDWKVWSIVQQIADSRTNPPTSVEDVLDELENAGLTESVTALRATSY
jgi:predicted nucleic acid-binding protein